MEALIVIAVTAVLFVTMILLLASKAGKAGKATGILVAIVALGGLFVYGYGFGSTIEEPVMAVVRSLLAVCYMFLGRNELSAIANAPLLQNELVWLFAWVLHLLALYITAGAAVVAVGSRVLKKLHIILSYRGHMNLIFGVNADSVSLGKEINAAKDQAVVFVGENDAGNFEAAIDGAGCVLRMDANALSANGKFLNAIGMNRRSRCLTVYALSKNPTSNIRYAQKLLVSLQDKRIPVERTRLVILCPEDHAVSQLQVRDGVYGYGYVAAVNEADLAARLLVRSFRPWEHITFDEDAKATQDFRGLIIGFGKTGQAVLKQLIMNGQFEGSRFHAAVFDPEFTNASGWFTDANAELLKHYDISFVNADGRSSQLYAYLREQGQKLRYIAVCTGNDKLNYEICRDVCSFYSQMSWRVPVYQCSVHGVLSYDTDGIILEKHKVYTARLLGQEQLDRMAMIINERYQKDRSISASQHWMHCDYFSRQSCRASADFMDAMLYAAGKDSSEDWDLTSGQLENLSKTEHLRWCAFHYCMGYVPMTQDEFDMRAGEYCRQIKDNGKASIRISKNTAGRTHACLCSWEELRRLSEKEAVYTGKLTDYQAMDTENVLAVPALIRASK